MNQTLYSIMPEKVRKNLKRKVFFAGTPIILSGLENSNVYFLMEGYAEASVSNSSGGYVTIYIYSSDSVFGEADPFYNGQNKPVTITAITDCTVDILYKDDFLNWLKEDFEATKLLINILTNKLVHNADALEELLHLSVRDRFLRYIAIHNYKNTLTKLSKKQLSLEANIPIRSLNRTIKECEQKNLLCYRNKQFLVLNQHEVENYLPCHIKNLPLV